MRPGVAFELLELSRGIVGAFESHETTAMTEASYDPIRAFSDIVADLERHPDFYDAGFDDGLGTGNITTRISDGEAREVGVFITVRYELKGAGKKTSVRGTRPTEVSASFFDPDAISPQGMLGKEEVKTEQIVNGVPTEEVTRNLSLLLETVRAIRPQS